MIYYILVNAPDFSTDSYFSHKPCYFSTYSFHSFALKLSKLKKLSHYLLQKIYSELWSISLTAGRQSVEFLRSL
jgi:hypothetical protein